MPTTARSSIGAATLSTADPAGQPPMRAIRSLRQEAGLAFAVVVAIGVPFAAFTGLLLHHFYISGSFLLDAGWTAYLLTHGGLSLTFPTALRGESYFIFHVSPLFVAIADLRRALPVSDMQFFAGFMGLCHALAGAAVLWTLYAGFRLRRGVPLAIAALIAVAFSFNGLALAIVRYPHSEILVVASVILFAVALVQRHTILAGVFLFVALLTREDAGLHVFALLALVVGLNRWHGANWRSQRTEIAYAAIALAYSVVAIAVQRALSDGTPTLTLTYLGNPPFVELTVERTLLRLQFYAAYRGYLVLPALIAAIWALRARNPYILVGYVAFLPWAMLQLIAHTDIAGTLSGYYAYPFMIASFWPLLGVLLDRRRRGVEGRSGATVLAFSAMIAASFVGVSQQYNPGRLDLMAGLADPPALARQAATDEAIARLARSKAALGALLVDTSIVALAPDAFTPGETVPEYQSGPLDTVVYYTRGFESNRLRGLAKTAGLHQYYRVPGTEIRIASNHPIPTAAPIAALLAAADTPD